MIIEQIEKGIPYSQCWQVIYDKVIHYCSELLFSTGTKLAITSQLLYH